MILREKDLKDFVLFDVTGFLVYSKTRFKISYSNYRMAFGINLWRGSVWGVKRDGKRKLLKRVYN